MLLAIFAFAFSTSPSWAQDTETQEKQAKERLNQLEKEIETSKNKRENITKQATQEKNFLSNLSSELVLRAKRARIQEDLLKQIENNISDLNEKIQDINKGLEGKRERLAELLAALQRLSQHPPALVLLRPNESLNTIQSASLLSKILPAISAEAEILKQEMTELEAAKASLSEEKEKEQIALKLVRQEQSEMAYLMAQRQEVYNGLLSEAQKTENNIARLVNEAQSVEALLKGLEANKLAAKAESDRTFKVPQNYPTNKPFTAAKGQLAFPVNGQVSERYNSQNSEGKLKGIKVKAGQNAQVIAPYDGQIVFAGPFRNYGQLLIIEHGEGYHTLMAGFSVIYGSVGQWVLTGEPVGVINQSDKDSDSAKNNSGHELYVEIRHDGKPINPATWLAPL